ncbi:MAG: histidinol-phosphatase HisJ family protein [Promethearchaeota archaeon]
MRFKITDFHIHTRPYSGDVAEDGPIFNDYIKIAEEQQINVCFLEHFELHYVDNDKLNPFYGGKIQDYLEKIDEIKETYDFVMGGLEVDYYKDKEIELLEFMDDYERELDFIAGSVHEWIIGYPVTEREKLLTFLKKKSMKDIINEYFETFEMMINSKIFRNVCHIDTIFRYINDNDLKPEKNCDISEDRITKLGKMCINNKIKIEYNISGLKFPIQRPFPSREVASLLKKNGAKFFVGSDSHSLDYFEKQIPKLKEAYIFLDLI